MKRDRFSFLLPILLLLSACSGEEEGASKEQLLGRIDTLEQEVDSISSQGKLPEKKMRKLVSAYKDFAEQYEKDSLAPYHLFQAGNVARSLKEPQKAINIYQRILKDYPDFKKEPTVRFLLAFVYDQDLKKKKKARELYNVVIDSFPDHKLAEDARQYLKVMDLSDEELMKRFEKQQQKDSARADTAKDPS